MRSPLVGPRATTPVLGRDERMHVEVVKIVGERSRQDCASSQPLAVKGINVGITLTCDPLSHSFPEVLSSVPVRGGLNGHGQPFGWRAAWLVTGQQLGALV